MILIKEKKKGLVYVYISIHLHMQGLAEELQFLLLDIFELVFNKHESMLCNF